MYFPKISVREMARKIDNTLLKPDATINDIENFCRESMEYGFIGICVNSCYVKYASKILKNSESKIVSTVGFPLGAISKEIKVKEAENALKNGAEEIDMVMNIGMFKSGKHDYIRREIESVLKKVHSYGGILKVIVETSLLSDLEIIAITRLLEDIGVDYIKTNTGFIGKANIHDVMVIKRNVRSNLKIKVAGGIRHYEEVLLYLSLGAERIGTSSGINIIKKYREEMFDQNP